jgi:hypothetical protein
MPRYVIESLGARHVPVDDVCAKGCAVIVQNDLTEKVSWLHSYVTLDRSRTFCICDWTFAGGHSSSSAQQPSAGRTHHRGEAARSLLVSLAARARLVLRNSDEAALVPAGVPMRTSCRCSGRMKVEDRSTLLSADAWRLL